METAQAELATLRDPNVSDLPGRAQTEVLLRPFTRGFMAPEEEWAVYGVLLGLLLFLLVMAGNVAGLLLARNAVRMREIALRTALGASYAQLMRQLLTEAALLGGMSAAAGLLLASACLSYVASRVNDLPWWFSADLSFGMAGFAVLAALLASAVAGIAPALKLTRVSANDVLKGGNLCTGRLRFSWLTRALIAAQIAITIAFVTTLAMLGHALFGFEYERYSLPAREVLVAQLYFGQPPNLTPRMSTTARRAEWSRFLNACREKQREIARRLSALPDVREVSYASLLPGNDVESAVIEFEPEAGVPRRDQQPQTRVVQIGSGFFPLMGVRPVQGRDFLPPEHEGDPRAVIVNEPFARKHFGGAGVLGRRVRLAPTTGQPAGQWLEIVGVVRDLGLNPGDPDRADGIYMPLGPTNVVRLA
ncbi:MAG: ABC transporter permease, partial [Candidatus Acidiferrales bacterium]